MTDFDDFDWVDRPTERKRGTGDREPVDQRRAADRAARPNPRTEGRGSRSSTQRNSTPPRNSASARDYAPPRRSAPGPRTNGQSSRGRAIARRPRRTIWSQIGGGLRSAAKSIGRLPKPLLIGAAALVFIIALTMILDAAMFYSKVHAGVSVAGQDLGGKTYDEAYAVLIDRVDELSSQPITVASDSESWTVTPDEVGQIVDFEATIQTAMQVSRKSNFVVDLAKRLGLYFSGDSLAFAGELDQEKLDAFVTQIAGRLDVDPVNQSLSIQGDALESVAGTNGYVVDQEKLKSELMQALFGHTATEVLVPMTTKAPDAIAADPDEAVAMVQTMMNGNLTLTYLAPRPEDQVPATTADQQTGVDGVEQTTTTTIPQTTTTTIVETAVGKLTFIRKSQTFSPAEIGELLDYRMEDRDGVNMLVPYISAEKLGPLFHRIEGPMTVPAVDAYFATMDRGFTCTVIPGQQGKGLDHEATAAALTEAALQTDNRVAEALVKDIDPDFTTEDAESMGITQALGSFETIYEAIDERNWNVALATAKVSSLSVDIAPGDPKNLDIGRIAGHGNLLLAPGEEFDFAKILGPRTNQAGFVGAVGIEDGQLVEGILGGGICQVSTTMFNAVMRAGLHVTERWNHSLFIEHYPEGLDATITGGGNPKNLKFINDTPNYIWIYGWSSGIKTTFTIFGTSDGRRVALSDPERYDWRQRSTSSITVAPDPELETGETKVVSKGQDAFKVRIIRTITWPDGREVSDEWISEWGIKPRAVAYPTSSTDIASPNTVTTAPSQ